MSDVLGQNVDSPATGQYAESQGIPWVGYDSNASKFAPKSWLTAATYNWGIYYLKRVKEAMAGTWKPGFYYGGIKDGFTGLAPYGPSVSAATKAAIAAKMKAIANGTLLRVHGADHRPERQGRRPEGQEPDGAAALRGQLARQGRDRQPEGVAARAAAFGASAR